MSAQLFTVVNKKIILTRRALSSVRVDLLPALEAITLDLITASAPSVCDNRDESELIAALEQGNFMSRVSALLTEAARAVQSCDDGLVQDIIDADSITWATSPRTSAVNNDFCSQCGSSMTYMQDTAEMYCEECGFVYYAPDSGGADDTGMYKTHKHRSGMDTTRHYRYCIECLQAHDSSVDSDAVSEVVDKIRPMMAGSPITCDVVRSMLKKVGATCYNDHVPLISTLLGGPTPPVFTGYDLRAIELHFNRIMTMYERIGIGNHNRPNYYYFIYKIIEQLFTGDKLRMLKFIHLQSRSTITKNDLIFEELCKQGGHDLGLVYRPTRT